MLRSQKIWRPAVEHSPEMFATVAAMFTKIDLFTRQCFNSVGITPESVVVAPAPNPRHAVYTAAMAVSSVAATKMDAPPLTIAQHMAASFTVPPPVVGAGGSTDHGYLLTLMDSFNSLHIIERLLPAAPPHVSVNMQLQLLAPEEIGEGAQLVVVSTVEKMGKRFVYCSTDFYVDSAEEGAAAAGVETIEDLQRALLSYRRVAHGTHVKAIAPSATPNAEATATAADAAAEDGGKQKG